MTIDLDFSHEAMTPDAVGNHYSPKAIDPAVELTARERWLLRRGYTWGASEIGPLLIAFGLAPLDHASPVFVMENVTHYKRLGIPKLIAWKAGLRAEKSRANDATDGGNALERPLFEEWKRTWGPKYVQPRRCHHASAAPEDWLPFVDRRCKSIGVTPDAWGQAIEDAAKHVALEVKNLRMGMERPTWSYVQQVRAQISAMGASHGFLIVGEYYLWDDAPADLKNIKTFRIEPSAEDTARQFAVATEAWALVERLRELRAALDTSDMSSKQLRQTLKARKAAGATCAALFAESVERLRPYRTADATSLDAALAGIEFETTGLEGA